VLTCGPPLLVGGLLVSSYLISLPLVSDLDSVGMRQSLLGYLPPLLSTLGFTVLFYAVPNCRVRFRHALAGGLLTMVFFEGAKRLFTTIVANLNMQVIYGTFAAVPLFLTWLYLVWMLVLSGAILVRTLALERTHEVSDGAPLLVQCVRVLAFLRRAHREGRAVQQSDVDGAVPMSPEERGDAYAVLAELKLVTHLDSGHMVLGRDLRCVPLLELYQRLPVGIVSERLEELDDLPKLMAPLRECAEFGAQHLAIDVDAVVADDTAQPRADA
jgi:membrane protein